MPAATLHIVEEPPRSALHGMIMDMLSDPAIVADPDRLATLAAHDILDTAPEEGFDDIVRLATRLCAVKQR